MTNNDLMLIEQLERVIEESSLAVLNTVGKIERALRLAAGIGSLRGLLTEKAMQPIMALQGSALGFRTDKDRDGGYPAPVVRECLIEAVLRGLNPVGNEYNIIGGRMYVTREGLTRMVREIPGLAGMKLHIGLPKLAGDKGAVVQVSATWTLDGKPDAIEPREVPIRVNSGMGGDAIIGKATRKLLALVYSQATGSATGLIDGEAGDTGSDGHGPAAPAATATSADLNDAIKGQPAKQKCPKCKTNLDGGYKVCPVCKVDLPEVPF
jgi:hypothetical protein